MRHRIPERRRLASAIRVGAALLVTALTLGACTDPGPDEQPSQTPSAATSVDALPVDTRARVAVIVGPTRQVAPGEAAALATAASSMTDAGGESLAEVRVMRARSGAFAGDLVELAMLESYDVICIVGTGTAALLVEAARTHRAQRFCGTDAGVELPPTNVSVVGLDALGLAELGAAAAFGAASPVALVVGASLAPVDSVEAAFRDGLGPPPEPPSEPPAPEPTATPAAGVGEATIPRDDPTEQASAGATPEPVAVPDILTPPVVSADRVLALSSDGVEVSRGIVDQLRPSSPSVAVLLAPGAAGAGRLFVEQGASLVVVAAWAVDEEGQLPGEVLLSIRVDWAAQLEAAIVAGLADGDGAVTRLGIADGVLSVVEGTASGTAGAARRAQVRIDDAASA